jgi:CheY-like chemotaxis protein
MSQTAAKRILVVDDDKLIVSLLEAGLTEWNSDFPVVTALSAKEALDKIRHEAFALVITGYQMPDMNGVELIAQIREQLPEAYIVLMSAHPRDLMTEMVGETQAHGYLEKPISIYRLWELAESVLGKS